MFVRYGQDLVRLAFENLLCRARGMGEEKWREQIGNAAFPKEGLERAQVVSLESARERV